MVVFLIILGITLIIWLYFLDKHSFIKRLFKKGSCIVFGYKGTGKDLIFQKAIALRKKEKYTSYPQPYGYNHSAVKMKDISLYPNTFASFIEGKVTVLEWELFEQFYKADTYWSDGGVILPSFADNLLTKLYPSFPITYALRRQLFESSDHINTQSLSRIWIKIREQADTFLKALYSLNLGFGILVRVRYFQEYQSADSNLLPFKASFGGKQARALKKQFTATNGSIKDFFIFVWKSQIRYDSWYYRKVVFKNYPSTDYEKRTEKRKGVEGAGCALSK